MDASSSRTTLSRRQAIVFGGMFALFGVFPLLIAAGVVTPQGPSDTPRWVVGAIGLMFVLAGVAIVLGYAIAPGIDPDGQLSPDTPFSIQVAQYLVGLAIVALMTLVFAWVGFGPGERHFSTTISLPAGSARGASSSRSGRIAFGGVSLLMFAMLVALGVSGARRLRRIRAGSDG